MKPLLLAAAIALPFAPVLHAQIPAAPVSRAPAPATAPDLVTRSGKEYKAARVFRVEPDGINYMFAGGMVKVAFEDLPEAVQKQYGYDPLKAKAFADQDAQTQAIAAAEAARQTAEYQKQLRAQQAQYASQVADAKRAAEIAATPLPSPEHYYVNWASTRKGGYMASLKPSVLHSYSNSAAPDATGLNRTYYYTKDPDLGSYQGFVIWDCDKNPITDNPFEVDLYPCGNFVSDGKKYPMYAANAQDYVVATTAQSGVASPK